MEKFLFQTSSEPVGTAAAAAAVGGNNKFRQVIPLGPVRSFLGSG